MAHISLKSPRKQGLVGNIYRYSKRAKRTVVVRVDLITVSCFCFSKVRSASNKNNLWKTIAIQLTVMIRYIQFYRNESIDKKPHIIFILHAT